MFLDMASAGRGCFPRRFSGADHPSLRLSNTNENDALLDLTPGLPGYDLLAVVAVQFSPSLRQ